MNSNQNNPTPARLVVLISGSGSNLQAIIDACESKQINATIKGVISNKAGVKGLQRASEHGIDTQILDHTLYSSREDFDQALQSLIDGYHPDLVVLAGFMRILTPAFTKHYLGRMLNIHPSLLPKYQGLHTHQRAIDAGDKEHGVSVHFVTAELDGGPLVLQAKVPILPGDSAETLAARVLIEEHRIYPLAIGWFAQKRLCMREGKSYLDGKAVRPSAITP